MKIPFLSFENMNRQIKAECINTFENFFDKAWYVLGDEVNSFEQQYAQFNHVQHCIGVSNGLDALYLALKALGIGQGDEVIVPSNTYIATVLAVSYIGAKPVLVEPSIDTYNIDPQEIEKVISPKTKAIIPVHLYGQCCEMKAIMVLAHQYGLYVIEDNAQSQGSTFNGQLAGSFGHANGTSFYPGKNLGALGDAGAVTTNDAALANQIRILRNYGSEKKYFNEVIGHNMRLDEIQAAFLSVKLKYLSQWTRHRQEIAAWYNEGLAGIEGITLPFVHPAATHVYHLYVIRSRKRDALQEHLHQNGIGTLIHYPVPPHLQKAYQQLNFTKGSFPLAEEIADTCLSLPLWPGMTQREVAYIADKVKEFSQ